MEIIRAIYIGDVRYNESPVFQLGLRKKDFWMLEDADCRYPVECILEDDDWLIFKITYEGTEISEGKAVVINRDELRKLLIEGDANEEKI